MSRKISGAALSDGGVRFSLWAPNAASVDVVVNNAKHRLQPMADGWYEAQIDGVGAGAQYVFRIDDKTDIPDPASAFQPNDVSGPSEVIDHEAFQWTATGWRGRPWEETVLIETHVGTFTEVGTYRAMIDRLDHLVAAGFTALELMPVADFSGQRNWGYDGVLWYAPDSAYGRPEDLKTLIDEAHRRGLMVFLDVVYNHFGPEGNYLGLYAPQFFSDAQTPWGSAIDYSRREVRDFAVENALMWLRDYRFDGLRLDAVHAIVGNGKTFLLHELSHAAGQLAEKAGRSIHLVLENDDNEVVLLDPLQAPAGKYRAQWNDDYHHAWHVLLSGESGGYYSDYAAQPLRHLTRTLTSGFAYQGEPSPHRGGATRGEPSGKLPPTAFVNFLQNHDQIGNRALGERLDALASPEAIAAALQVTLLAPAIPMLFMGDEWGAKSPFPFFCDFRGDLADAVRAGRRKEFAAAYAKYGDNVPDPLAEETLRLATLDWNERSAPEAQVRLEMVKRLLAVRQREIVPHLKSITFGDAKAHSSGLLTAWWRMGGGRELSLVANLSNQSVEKPAQSGRVIWGSGDAVSISSWSVIWRVGASA